jgi:hypothetical protein
MTATYRRVRTVGLLILAVAAVLLSPPVRAHANPAIDEYKDRFPTATGKNHGDAGVPTGNPLDLPPGVAGQLANDPNGKALAAIATASSLGAPVLRPGDTGSGTSLLHALLDPVFLLLLLGVVAIVAWTRTAARRA